MEIKLIIIAVIALVASVSIFKGCKPLPTLVGFVGMFCAILFIVNAVMAKF
jgi:hypothetical protein